MKLSTEKIQKSAELCSASVCERIEHVANKKGMKRSELAEAAKVSDRLVYKVMRHKANLRDSTIGQFAQALDVPFEFLLTGKGDVVKDSKGLYQRRWEHEENPMTVSGAVEFLAKQFEINEDRLYNAVMDLVRGKGGQNEVER